MHFLGNMLEKSLLFHELPSLLRHILQFAGCSGEPSLLCPPTALCPCFMQRCEQLATKPLRVWGFFVPKPLCSAFASLPSWLRGPVIFPSHSLVSAVTGCALCLCMPGIRTEEMWTPKKWLINTGTGVTECLLRNRSSWLRLCANLLKKYCVARQKIWSGYYRQKTRLEATLCYEA
jgi:hypothetical protein